MKPWEEENGYYGMMVRLLKASRTLVCAIYCSSSTHSCSHWLDDVLQSHVLRNCVPSFVFSVKSMDVDSRVVKNGQIVNHFRKANNITTKVRVQSLGGCVGFTGEWRTLSS